MKWLTNIAPIALGVFGAALIVTLLVVGAWSYDVWNDRKHTVVVTSETPIFAGAGDEDCEGTRLTVVQPGATLRVRRIRYWKNCRTVDIVLPDGREGHIASGDGEVSISPPLN
jgi:hypothetical protein